MNPDKPHTNKDALAFVRVFIDRYKMDKQGSGGGQRPRH